MIYSISIRLCNAHINGINVFLIMVSISSYLFRWYQCLPTYLLEYEICATNANTNIYTKCINNDLFIVDIYVHDYFIINAQIKPI